MEEELKKYETKNYYYSLALESYEDHTGIESDKIHDTWAKLDDYRKTRETLSLKEKITILREIAKEFEEEIETAGKEKFDMYDDGYTEYIWSSKE